MNLKTLAIGILMVSICKLSYAMKSEIQALQKAYKKQQLIHDTMINNAIAYEIEQNKDFQSSRRQDIPWLIQKVKMFKNRIARRLTEQLE